MGRGGEGRGAEVVKEYETLTAWLKEEPLKDLVSGKGRGGERRW